MSYWLSLRIRYELRVLRVALRRLRRWWRPVAPYHNMWIGREGHLVIAGQLYSKRPESPPVAAARWGGVDAYESGMDISELVMKLNQKHVK